LADGQPIAGQTATDLYLDESLISKTITAAVTGTVDGYEPLTLTSDPVGPIADVFGDVATDHFFNIQIEWMRTEGITNGNVGPGGTLLYLPDDPVSRQAMAAFLYRMDGSPSYTPPGESSFTDMVVGAPFAKEVEWMKAQAITTGYDNGNGTFSYHPIENVSRQSMAVFLYRFAHRLPTTG
jgi:hypothetical protein